MNRRTGIIVSVLAVVIAAGAFGYWFVLGEPEAPSAEIEAIPLDQFLVAAAVDDGSQCDPDGVDRLEPVQQTVGSEWLGRARSRMAGAATRGP